MPTLLPSFNCFYVSKKYNILFNSDTIVCGLSDSHIYIEWIVNWTFCFLSFTSATSGGILDRAIEAEDRKHGDFLRLVMILFVLLPFLPLCPFSHVVTTWIITCQDWMITFIYSGKKTQLVSNLSALILQDHVEGYLELSAKTKTYFATAVNLWDADFYIKVDDDVHVNIGI